MLMWECIEWVNILATKAIEDQAKLDDALKYDMSYKSLKIKLDDALKIKPKVVLDLFSYMYLDMHRKCI